MVGRPRADVVVPGALPGRLLRPPRDALAHRAPAVVDDRGRLGALRRGAHRALRRSHPRAHPDRGGHPVPHARRGGARRRGRRGVRRGRHRRARRPGAGAADRSQRGGGRGPGRLPLPAQRGGPAHRPGPAAAPTRRVGGMELSPARRAARPLRRHLLHEPPAVPRCRPALLRDAQPHGRHRTRARHPGHPLRAPDLHARGDVRAAPPRGDQRRIAHALLRRLLAWGFHEDGVVSAHEAVAGMRARVPA